MEILGERGGEGLSLGMQDIVKENNVEKKLLYFIFSKPIWLQSNFSFLQNKIKNLDFKQNVGPVSVSLLNSK